MIWVIGILTYLIAGGFIVAIINDGSNDPNPVMEMLLMAAWAVIMPMFVILTLCEIIHNKLKGQ